MWLVELETGLEGLSQAWIALPSVVSLAVLDTLTGEVPPGVRHGDTKKDLKMSTLERIDAN
jgi:hypothetical protein